MFGLEIFAEHLVQSSNSIVYVFRMKSYEPNLLQYIKRKKANNMHQNDQK